MKKEFLCYIAIHFGFLLTVHGDTNFAGAAMTSDSSGTKSVLVSGRNGAPSGVGIFSRSGGVGPVVRVGPGYSGNAYPSGGVSASAGGTGAYAGPGGAYAGANPWGFPYWGGGGGAYASSAAGVPLYYPYNYDYPYAYGGGMQYGNRYNGLGSSSGTYSSSNSNGISTRLSFD